MTKFKDYKAGYIAVVGMPNAGKSSLVNALVGEKVSIVSSRPQTTRNKILGIKTMQNYQMVFVDTPGEVQTKGTLNDFMQKSIDAGVRGADIVLFVIDGTKPVGDSVLKLLQKYTNKNKTIVAYNKVDASNYEKMFPQLAKLNCENVKAIVPVSAKTGKNIEELIKVLLSFLPEGEMFFAEGQYTDQSVRNLAAEIIREKTLRLLNEEVPHGIAVEITKFDESKKDIIKIEANLICERENHKNIIIGKSGAKIKDISTRARQTLESVLENKVFLQVFVQVKENWREKQALLKDFGYDKKTLKN